MLDCHAHHTKHENDMNVCLKAFQPGGEHHMGDGKHYRVVRFYRDADIRRRVIIARCTLDEAQAHCSDPETSSSKCTKAAGKARTRRMGAWFDGYEER